MRRNRSRSRFAFGQSLVAQPSPLAPHNAPPGAGGAAAGPALKPSEHQAPRPAAAEEPPKAQQAAAQPAGPLAAPPGMQLRRRAQRAEVLPAIPEAGPTVQPPPAQEGVAAPAPTVPAATPAPAGGAGAATGSGLTAAMKGLALRPLAVRGYLCMAGLRGPGQYAALCIESWDVLRRMRARLDPLQAPVSVAAAAAALAGARAGASEVGLALQSLSPPLYLS